MGSQAFRSAVAEPQPAEVAPEPVRRSVGIPKQSLTPPQRTVAIAAVAVLAGLIAATSGASPTTIGWWNAVLSFGFGALLVAAASKGPRWSSIMFSTVAMAAASINLWTLVGAVGLVLAVLSAGLDRRNRVVAAMAAACSLQLMLRWPAFGFFGLPSLVAGAMAAVVLVQGYRYGEKRQRSIARRSAVGLALVTLVVAAVSGIQLLNARPDIEQGLEAGRAAVKAVTDADPDTAVAELDAAQRSLEAARSSVDAPGAKLLQFVPIAAQHYDVLSTALHHGTEITDQVAATAQDANIRSISLELGSVDLSTLDVLAPNLQETSRRLDAAQTDIETSRTGWLVRPVDSRTQATLDELTDIAHTTRVASDAATVLPEMLGQADPKRYLVMFGTPTEAREFGGLFGSWGLIEFNQGRVDLVESGRVIRLKPLGLQNGLDAQQYPEWFVEFAQPAEFPQNLTGTPSERVLAEAAREMFDGLGGGAIDGVIYLDVVALIDLLEVTGPVEIPLQDAPLTTENAAEFFFRDQYAFDSGRGRSEAFNRLAEVAAVVLDRMSAQRLPGPERLGRILGPAARGGHLQVITFDQEENDFLQSVQLQRRFGEYETEDFVALVHSNIFGNKLDLYLTRQLTYDVTIDSDGIVRATATATFTSTVPADAPSYALGLPENEGRNRLSASFYTPYQVAEARINGVPVGFESVEELGLNRYVVPVELEPDGTPQVVEFDVIGAVAPAVPYSVSVWRQPLINPDVVAVTATQDGDQVFDWSAALVENLVLDQE